MKIAAYIALKWYLFEIQNYTRNKTFWLIYMCVHTKFGSDYNGTISGQTSVVFFTVSLNVIPKQGSTLNAKKKG